MRAPALGDSVCRLQELAFGFDRARAGHHNEVAAADLDVAHLHHATRTRASLGYKIEARELAVPFWIHESRHSSKRQMLDHY